MRLLSRALLFALALTGSSIALADGLRDDVRLVISSHISDQKELAAARIVRLYFNSDMGAGLVAHAFMDEIQSARFEDGTVNRPRLLHVVTGLSWILSRPEIKASQKARFVSAVSKSLEKQGIEVKADFLSGKYFPRLRKLEKLFSLIPSNDGSSYLPLTELIERELIVSQKSADWALVALQKYLQTTEGRELLLDTLFTLYGQQKSQVTLEILESLLKTANDTSFEERIRLFLRDCGSNFNK